MTGKLVAVLVLTSVLLQLTEGACKTDSLTSDEQAILDKHNEMRALHQDTEPLCYGESGDDVTFTAQEFATESASAGMYTHSKDKQFGENISNHGYAKGYTTVSEAYIKATRQWQEEKAEGRMNDDYYYYQVVWRNSKQLNCGTGKYEQVSPVFGEMVTFYMYKVVCQYYPPGNNKAGAPAEDIGDKADNIGALKTVTCNKPTVSNGTVTPAADTVEQGSKYTVTCSEKYTIVGAVDTFTCTEDGTLAPASHTCKPNIARRETLSLALILMLILLILN